MTLKATEDGPATVVATGAAQRSTSSPVDVTANLTIHADGSASMTLPGASVTLTPRRTSPHSGGEYEIRELLGMGGMGVVNRARQASLDRAIVVKSIRPEYAGRAEAQEKFITEALATGSLDHPNVVPVHDMGVAQDGSLFYVMKEVRGRNWREVIRDLTEMENIDILLRVCDAIAFAHDRGIIHRDIKPENVMLGDFGEVLVMDWGLAAAVEPNAKATHITTINACAGTPSFMAPEMARAWRTK
ncbi:MAG: serine/threonine protein kinase [Planctomycetaceae bacterium]|nr:serine/threonine protein kinase [Planctomycetaceae bacterium]